MDKDRISALDLIRFFACFFVATWHFYCSVSGTFIYSNSILPSLFVENRLSMGGIGVSLFFMLSGASLMLTYKAGNLRLYAKKRFLAIYPMFWIAYAVATVADFLRWKKMGIGNIKLLIFTALGMDGYLSSHGVISPDFYKLGEWFLGCIILLYLLFPLLHYCMEKKPSITSLCVFGGYTVYILGTHFWGFPYNEWLFFLRIPEILLGMLFIKYDLRHKPKIMFGISGAAAWFAILFRRQITPLTLCICVCMFLFALLIWAGEKITSESIKSFLCKAAGLTYPIFLVHHWLIDRLVIGFDLPNLAKRDVAMLFVIYMIFTIVLAQLLYTGSRKVVSWFLDVPAKNGGTH